MTPNNSPSSPDINNYFSSSLRRHPDWAPVVSHLRVMTDTKEAQLDNHDLSLFITVGRYYRFALLSKHDMGDDEKLKRRLEQLSILQGGQDTGVAFLLEPGGDVESLMKLQITLTTTGLLCAIQVMPVASPTNFTKTLQAFKEGLVDAAIWMRQCRPPHPVRDLIPYCTTNTAITPHTAFVLSDIRRDFREHASRLATRDGVEEMVERLGKVEARGVVDFMNRQC